jgi:hypothetical protein
MIVDRIALEDFKSLTEDTKNIMTSDSIAVSVVTGYSENNMKRAKFSYTIPSETISSIKNSHQLLIRYYSGPSMMTIKPKYRSLTKLKQLIDIK